MRYPYNNFSADFTTTAGNRYGDKVEYGYHSGVDINGKGGGNSDCGIPIYAMAHGLCTSVVKSNRGYGNHLHIQIEGPWGIRWTHHCHLQEIFINKGDVVPEGKKVATIGTTGSSTACHDHWEIKKKQLAASAIAKTEKELADGWENPILFVEQWIGEGGGMQEELNSCREARDAHWDDLIAIKQQLGVVGDADIDTTLRSIRAIQGLAGKVQTLEGELSAVKSNRKEEVDRLNLLLLNKEKTISSLRSQLSSSGKALLDQISSLEKQLDSMAKEKGNCLIDLAKCQSSKEKGEGLFTQILKALLRI